MQYIVNIFLDETAPTVGDGGPNTNAHRCAYLWFKNTGTGQGAMGWIPVPDPLTVSQAADTVGFTLGDVYGELSSDATYKITFSSSSPFDPTTTQSLAQGTFDWQRGTLPISGLKNPTDYVSTGAELTLANTGTFEFTIQVDDGDGTEVYYLDPRMIVDP